MGRLVCLLFVLASLGCATATEPSAGRAHAPAAVPPVGAQGAGDACALQGFSNLFRAPFGTGGALFPTEAEVQRASHQTGCVYY